MSVFSVLKLEINLKYLKYYLADKNQSKHIAYQISLRNFNA